MSVYSCAKCGGETEVKESRCTTVGKDKMAVRRRRCCRKCKALVTTYEMDAIAWVSMRNVAAHLTRLREGMRRLLE